MEDRIRDLLGRITSLEDELKTLLGQQEVHLLYRLEGKRVQFEHAIHERHRRLKMGVVRWLLASRPQNLLSAPFIYGMVVPFAFFDLCLWLYQSACFPLYGIPRVRRSHYIVMDRGHLGYLNLIERLHCLYCGYANGLIAYAREIAARTEQYWCPIKHAHRILDPHARYVRFLEYGAADDYHARLEAFRAALPQEGPGGPNAGGRAGQSRGGDRDREKP